MSAAVSLAKTASVHLPVLSNSALSTYRSCPREFRFRYIQLRRPRRSSEALRFGTLFHLGLEAWWADNRDALSKLETAVATMRQRADDETDPYDLVKAEELMLGYTARWGSAGYETVAVEQEFDVPLVNPATGAESRTYRIQGKIDVVVKKDGKLIQVEHKTTSSDLSEGSDYWRKVSAMDPQVSTYQAAAKALGYPVDHTIYDVIRKVGLIPKKATPEESRRYTKKGLLDARQRTTDEAPEEFRERVRADITEKPEKYFGRGPIVRLERDEQEHAGDVWQTAWMIRESENANRFPRNPGACERFHRLCDYWDVCSGQASIDDDTRFRTAATAHEELGIQEVSA